MIKFENTEVFNFEGAIRGMRNPLNSWSKSDSGYCYDDDCDGCPHANVVNPMHIICTKSDDKFKYIIGENDLILAQQLIKAGSDHRKFLRQIFVSVDITAPLYWWKEMDQYRVAVVSNSCSTMHKIHAKELTLDDFSHEHLTPLGLETLKFIIDRLNTFRNTYVGECEGIPKGKKRDWWDMIQILPTSYNQKRTITLNYETLRNIYNSRRNHKLDEWSVGFMNWIDTLPYAEELIKY